MMSKPSVFITRKVSSDSLLHALDHVAIISGQSLIQFSAIDFNPVIATPWIFFYSSRGVQFYFEGLPDKSLIIDYKVAVMGHGTLSTYQRLFGRQPDFIGNGTKEYAADFCNNLEESITFVKGVNSLSSVEQIVDRKDLRALTVYNNIPDFTKEIPDSDFYIITSPMNAEVFISKVRNPEQKIVVAIGETTNQKLKELGYLTAEIPDKPHEASIVQLLKTMIHE